MKKVERLNKKGKTVSTILKLQRCLIDIFDNLWYNYHNVSANANFEGERRKTLAVLKLAFCFQNSAMQNFHRRQCMEFLGQEVSFNVFKGIIWRRKG